jgi:hypothetical protein
MEALRFAADDPFFCSAVKARDAVVHLYDQAHNLTRIVGTVKARRKR